MTGRLPRDQWPWWVKVGIFGSSSRNALWAWAGLSLIAAAAFGVLAAIEGDLWWWLGVVVGVWAALMYWLTIRWIDGHGSWDEVR